MSEVEEKTERFIHPLFKRAAPKVDCMGMAAPLPIMKVAMTMKEKVEKGEVLTIECDDPDFERDIIAWTHRTYNEYIGRDGNTFKARKDR